MSFALGTAKQRSFLFHLLTGCKVGKGNIELCIFHIHIHTDQALVRRELHACLNGIIKEIPNDAAQINFRGLQLDGNVCICYDLNFFRFRKRDLGIENSIGHRITSLDNRINGSQIFVEQIKIILNRIQITACRICFNAIICSPRKRNGSSVAQLDFHFSDTADLR